MGSVPRPLGPPRSLPEGDARADHHLALAARHCRGSAEVLFQSHNWPRWGVADIKDYLINTAAVYQFINDQTLLYLNQGYTSNEISEMLQLPPDLDALTV